ncbi:kinesin family member C1 [Pancytospora epiphaga]|nr:kinesin family member C1 [Pancytospora epiphaga]
MKAKLDELEYLFRELSTISLRMDNSQAIRGTRCIMPDELDISTLCNRSTNTDLEGEGQDTGPDITEYKLMIAEYKRQIEDLKSEKEKCLRKIKTLRTELMEMKGAVQIICRIKPLASGSVDCKYDDSSILLGNRKFSIDRVFGPESRQSEIYREIKPLVDEVPEGYKVCIFAYGQTGSGKTYTMEGPSSDRGVVYRALDSLGEISKKLAGEGYMVEYSVRCLEIYNDNLRCLLSGKDVQFTYDGNCGRMQGCIETETKDISVVYDALHNAVTRRKVGDTECNMQSSRSHFVFIMKVFVRSATETREGAVVLVDLAGSERLSESKAENERLRETQCINKSLSALGNVFTALRRKDVHVPFRDTKLTYIMKEYLTNQSKTAMIVNIDLKSPSEAICSLRFASKVGECELGRTKRKITHDI